MILQTMRVLIINTSENAGGAAVAAGRLVDALNNNGVKAKMMVRDKATDNLTVATAGGKLRQKWNFLWERWCVFCHLGFSRKHLFAVDIANAGTDVTKTREFKEADVIHLHWVNQGMLSLHGIGKILDSGKPVVWTMHDMWPATAVCHLTFNCRKFTTECSRCPLIPGGNPFGDVARRVWRHKRKLLSRHGGLQFVACSRWLASEARKSRLLEGVKITSIPNPIDIRTFCPGDKATARRRLGLPLGRRLILFVAQNVSHANKGMEYLVRAAKLLDDTFFVAIGGSGPLTQQLKTLAQGQKNVAFLGRISDEELKAWLLACDVFCFPSVTKNEAFGIALAEAMAYEKPAVTFTIAGSGVNYVSLDKVTGIECPNGDVEAYAQALRTLESDGALRLRYGRAAGERVMEYFTYGRFAQQVRRLIAEL